MNDKLLSLRESAELMGVSVMTAWRHAVLGAKLKHLGYERAFLKAIRVGKSLVIKKEDALLFLEELDKSKAAHESEKFRFRPGAGRPQRDLSGKIFGCLKVTKQFKGTGSKKKWLCNCSCGQSRWVLARSLYSGCTSKTCYCYSAQKKRLPKSGLAKARAAWRSMKERCLNQNRPNFNNYGGRGISVCDRWKNSFEDFVSDVGLPPSEMHSLDRIDNEGHYEPGNCKWSTKKEQCRNTRRIKTISCRGESLSITEWCEKLGLKRSSVYGKLRMGRSPEEVLFHAGGEPIAPQG